MINRYFTIANFLLVTVGIYLCVNAFYTFVTARLDYDISPAAIASRDVSSPAALSQPPLADYAAIRKRNIFNSSTQEQGAAPVVDKKWALEWRKQTELNL